MSRQRFLAIAFFALFGLVGCGGGAPVSQVQPGAAGQAAGEEYLVGPGDALQIFVWDHPELSTNVQVRPDGRISTPLVEDLQAAGRSPTALARDIEVVLTEFVRSPVVTVIVQEFVGDVAQQVRVVGQAVEPRALQYRQGMTVLDVVIEVGGLSEFAAGNRATLIRRVNGSPTQIRVRLDDLLEEGRIEENLAVLPGDVLVIPESVF
jgi:polysaccharide export outer membrane protein